MKAFLQQNLLHDLNFISFILSLHEEIRNEELNINLNIERENTEKDRNKTKKD